MAAAVDLPLLQVVVRRVLHAQRHGVQVRLAFVTASRLGAFAGKVTKDEDAYLWQLAEDLWHAHEEGKLRPEQLLPFIITWSGSIP